MTTLTWPDDVSATYDDTPTLRTHPFSARQAGLICNCLRQMVEQAAQPHPDRLALRLWVTIRNAAEVAASQRDAEPSAKRQYDRGLTTTLRRLQERPVSGKRLLQSKNVALIRTFADLHMPALIDMSPCQVRNIASEYLRGLAFTGGLKRGRPSAGSAAWLMLYTRAVVRIYRSTTGRWPGRGKSNGLPVGPGFRFVKACVAPILVIRPSAKEIRGEMARRHKAALKDPSAARAFLERLDELEEATLKPSPPTDLEVFKVMASAIDREQAAEANPPGNP